MSIRRAITLAVLGAVVMTSTLVGIIGVARIRSNVEEITQDRVNSSLRMFQSLLDAHGERVSERVQRAAEKLDLEQPDLQRALESLRQDSGLLLLNVCDSAGRPLARGAAGSDAGIPFEQDPVLRRALAGQPSQGVIRLSPERLEQEGGAALRRETEVAAVSAGARARDRGALFWWTAVPLYAPDGTVGGAVYGGNTINRDFALVDELRDMVFPTSAYKGMPLGTVTIFLEDMRVATNVMQANQQRAVGTVVSDEVRQAVLGRGQTWNDRAWVVNAWYRSAYAPLRDPDGTPIGMLYVGLLEAPYRDAVRSLVLEFAGITAAGAALTMFLVIVVVGRITTPIRHLEEASTRMALGDLEHRLGYHSSFREIEHLSDNFREMQEVLHRRDLDLQEKNGELTRANADLDQANENYMTTLRFVTHELRSPLAAMQSIIDVVVGGYLGTVPDAVQGQLVRIKRNCEELQDMVKNYLDLARAERGELVPRMADFDYCVAVLHPCIDQVRALFDSRALQIEVEAPAHAPIHGDEELLRIALTNYLTNAAKYSAEGGRVRVTVTRGNTELAATVWNEGAGFRPEEHRALFGKFSRLKNENTASKRGSGLGLYLCQQILEMHGGRVWAESDPGQNALFGMALPVNRE